jgi:hypothetical protein
MARCALLPVRPDPSFLQKSMPLHISFYLYILAAAILSGSLLLTRLQPPMVKWFVPFLALTLIIELTGLITSRMNLRNLWMFNLFTCLEFLFYSYFYSRILINPKWVRVIRICMVVYPILFLVNIFWIEGFLKFHTITYRIGSVMVVTWCYLYFRQLMRAPGYQSIFRDPVFWISTGLLFFYTGFFFYMSAGYILLYVPLSISRIVWNAISDTLNTLLYTSYLIAFLCQAPKKKI